MKKYTLIGFIFLLVFLVSFGIGVYVYKITSLGETNIQYVTEIAETKVTDECVDEANDLLAMLANSREEKISPNAIFIMKKEYKSCKHTTKDYIEVPPEFVNITRQELEERYTNWRIENFAPREIVFIKEEEGICNEHYILREEQETIAVYSLGINDEESLKERTEITTKYLPQTDKINLQNGIRVNGKEALNRILEDYES